MIEILKPRLRREINLGAFGFEVWQASIKVRKTENEHCMAKEIYSIGDTAEDAVYNLMQNVSILMNNLDGWTRDYEGDVLR